MELDIFLCDDDSYFLKNLSISIENYLKKKKIKATFHFFLSGIDLITWLEENFAQKKISISFLFIDMVMPKQNGLDTLKKFREFDQNCIVFITSNYKEFVFNSFEINTFQYLLKPINPGLLEKNLDRALEFIKIKTKNFVLYTDKKHTVLSYDDIILIESFGRCTILHTTKGKYKTQIKISEFNNKLLNYNFLRTHKSFLINMEKVLYYKDNQFYLVNDLTADISVRKRANIIRDFNYFILYNKI